MNRLQNIKHLRCVIVYNKTIKNKHTRKRNQ